MLLYISTVHLNNLEGLKKTYFSIREMLLTDRKIFWLIKDGGSEQNVIDNIRIMCSELPNELYLLLHGSDNGIYDAMNQTIEKMTNDESFVLFLNSGDLLEDNIRHDLMLNLQRYQDYDLLYTNYLFKTKSGKIERRLHPSSIDFAYMLGKTINHQSVLFKVKWIKKYLFRPDYNIVADWIQLFSILKNEQIKCKHLAIFMISYEDGGYSSRNEKLRVMERKRFLKSIYSDWEYNSLEILLRLRTKVWYSFVVRALSSIYRSRFLGLISHLDD
jgi:hypothetical protein